MQETSNDVSKLFIKLQSVFLDFGSRFHDLLGFSVFKCKKETANRPT